jgi:hypothetical protein
MHSTVRAISRVVVGIVILGGLVFGIRAWRVHRAKPFDEMSELYFSRALASDTGAVMAMAADTAAGNHILTAVRLHLDEMASIRRSLKLHRATVSDSLVVLDYSTTVKVCSQNGGKDLFQFQWVRAADKWRVRYASVPPC